MLLSLSLAIQGVALAALFAHTSSRRFNIVTGYFLLWGGIFLVIAWNPLLLRPVTGAAALVLAVGMLAAFGGAVLGSRWIRSQPTPFEAVGLVQPRRSFRWAVGLAVASAGVGVAVLSFRNAVDAAAGGIGFDQLTAQQVRYYSVYGAASHAGVGTTLYSLAPLVAAGGIVLGRHRRLGYLFVAFAIFMAVQNPARTLVFYTALVALLSWLYYKPSSTAPPKAGARHWHRIGVVGVTLICLAGYFEHVGNLLNKSNPAQIRSGTVIPAALFSPTIYLTGSPEALSTALDDNVDPTQGEHGRTVWIAQRIFLLVDRGATAPSNIAQAVPIPYPYNTYTWAGDLWFDFGWLGVVLGGLFLGFVSAVVDERARQRQSALWSWWAAAWGVVLLSSIITFEVFWLQTVIWLLAGPLVFGVSKPARRPATAAATPRVTATG